MRRIFKISYVVLVCSMLFISACSDNDSDISGIANTKLSGKVFGTSFTAQGGKAFMSNEDISINITNTNATCSSDIFNFELAITAYVKPELGIYKNVNVIFNKKGATPINYFQGTVEVVRITSNEITVKLKADSSADNFVEGFVTIPYCK